ncbi:MAG: fructose-bisphosphatase [Deltaproteobacteria bacterium CG1_02_45_11]|nr:MAG: fructose-bisphosphatase [Deltaproteobacteria bacterium CG1_02_45_11]
MTKFGMTVTEHILSQQRKHPEATGSFTIILSELIVAAKIISTEVRKAGLADILGFTGEINVQGEEVKKLDDFAHHTIVKRMSHIGELCALVSEESADIIEIPSRFEKGNYILIFDPIDGSSNIEANINIGTIFSIHKKVNQGDIVTSADVLQPGSKQVAAGYFIYGTSTMMVYTTGNGINGFTLFPSIGEFLLSHENIRMPEKGEIFSVNMGYKGYWDDHVRDAVEYFNQVDSQKGLPYSLRYVGSLVADFHRTLIKGGIFMYPQDRKDPKKPHGKLRLLCECAPLAMIATQAGGLATDGHNDILNIDPQELHQRVPLFIGSKEDVTTAMAIMNDRKEISN